MPSDPLSRTWLTEELVNRLASAVEGMTMDRPFVVSQIPASQDAAAPPAKALLWRQPFAGTPGTLWLAAESTDWKALGAHVLTAAGMSADEIEGDPATTKSTFLEIVSQTAGGLAQAMSGKVGHEVTPSGGKESSRLEGSIEWSTLEVHLPDSAPTIYVGLDNDFFEPPPAAETPAEALPDPEPPKAAAAQAGTGSAAANQAATAQTTIGQTSHGQTTTSQTTTGQYATGQAATVATSKTFELLLDVELPVSISFGRAQIQLKDALKLTTGSIVELNRSISEPAEVIVNNCVIARGEVVVVEGNFGIRIQQVISRQDRLRTLY